MDEINMLVKITLQSFASGQRVEKVIIRYESFF